jgi:hypothetical protein
MQKTRLSPYLAILLSGDVLTLALVTLAGLGFHDELGRISARMGPTFLPLLAGWMLVAPHLRVYDMQSVIEPQSLWRPPWAMILATPFGLWLRALWLGTAMIPIFVLVMAGISALAMLAWRSLFLVIFHKRMLTDG